MELKRIRYQEQLDDFIEPFKNKGFDSIRYPGGTSKNGKHSSFVIYEEIFANERYSLVLLYKSSFHKREKLNLLDKYESPKKTATREFAEEIFVKINQKFLNNEPYVIEAKDNLCRKKIHKKYFFKYEKEILEFKEYILNFGEEGEETTTPFLIKNTLLRDNLFWTHYEAFKNGGINNK